MGRGLTVVEGDLFPTLDITLGEHGELGHVGVEIIDEDTEDVEVRITAVVNKVREISKVGGIHSVDVLLAEIEVQIKEVGSPLGVGDY